jgi:hypothetical protein
MKHHREAQIHTVLLALRAHPEACKVDLAAGRPKLRLVNPATAHPEACKVIQAPGARMAAKQKSGATRHRHLQRRANSRSPGGHLFKNAAIHKAALCGDLRTESKYGGDGMRSSRARRGAKFGGGEA